MTDDELLAEVEALLQGGDRGESAEIEGTPEGTYLWMISHLTTLPVGPSPSISFTTTVEWQYGVPVAASLMSPQNLSIGAVVPNP